MKKSSNLLAASLLTASLVCCSTSAWAAAIVKDGLINSSGQIMTEVSTFAGQGDYGSYNGERQLSTFRNPSALLITKDGTMLVSDTKNHMLRSVSDTKVSTFAGLLIGKDDKGMPEGGRLDGPKDHSVFREPAGLAADSDGSVYVADTGNNAIRKIDAGGNVTTIAGNGLIGDKDGKGLEATFNHPLDVAVAPNGMVYVADTLNHAIRSIGRDGQVTTLTALPERAVEVTPGQAVWAGDYLDGDITASRFNEPSALAVDKKGNLFISDSGNQRIRYMDFGTGKVTTIAGGGSGYGKTELYAPGDFADGDAEKARFHFPLGIAITEEGGLLIADSLNHSIRYLYEGRVVTLAGGGERLTGEADGIEGSVQFQKPTDVAISAHGDVYVTDAYNGKVRKLELYRLPADLSKDDSVKVVIGSQAIAFDAPPEIENGRTMVPVRVISEALGYKVDYQDENRTILLKKGDVTIELYIGKTGIKRIEKGKPDVVKSTDAASYVNQDRTYVPVRFFAEGIGLDVQWDNSTRTAILREKRFEK